ncbi:hypothetical protein RM844_16955 [Streptomyces sp. DSM 44915]|uniref:Holin n=1 Tax=Streptomyces chisholmiae TaxID=3075540 RepID=A0ABU2JSK1_9ACTN|nr:hypothetical protein [Streptomyces sp. DSM 44915]MDT0267971.1 hypothetical protein [Streptomyces sp. DSM 44915]
MWDAVREWLRANPVRVRAGIAAVVGWLSHQVPQLEQMIGSDELVGVLMGLVTLALGESASRRVATSKAAEKTYDGRKLPD